MTTHGLPAKLTTTNRCTSRPPTAIFFSRESTNGAEGPNVAEVASRAFCEANAQLLLQQNKQERNEMRPALSTYSNRPGGPR
ncbi:hypothetical protein FIBSPDRAFT_858880, partial [Athelia psychrophila]